MAYNFQVMAKIDLTACYNNSAILIPKRCFADTPEHHFTELQFILFKFERLTYVVPCLCSDHRTIRSNFRLCNWPPLLLSLNVIPACRHLTSYMCILDLRLHTTLSTDSLYWLSRSGQCWKIMVKTNMKLQEVLSPFDLSRPFALS